MNALRFALGSCQYVGGLLDKGPAYDSYGRLDALVQNDKPDLLLLVGDQVYADATAGLFDPTLLADRFHRPYKLLYGQPSVLSVGARLDVYCMMDDHELEDNWEPIQTASGIDYGNLDAAVGAYEEWERRQGPAIRPRAPGAQHDSLWFTLDRGPVGIFVADTRTERTPRTAMTVDDASIMSPYQFGQLCEWLRAPRHARVIACPAIVLPRRLCATGDPAHALRSDAWDGYRCSLHSLLAFIAKNEIPNVLFVSGDEHLACIARITLRRANGTGKEIVARSIHSPALYAPYPFANTVAEDLIAIDHFPFTDPEDPSAAFECEVETRFPGCGDGFASVSLVDDGTAWNVACTFRGQRATVSYDAGLNETARSP